jgi:hypothetical protein
MNEARRRINQEEEADKPGRREARRIMKEGR